MSEPLRPILVVEDDLDIRESLMEMLTLAGLEAHGASDGADALDVLASINRRWVILLDLNMSGLDGWGFLDELAKLSVADDAFHVIITSAHPRARELSGRRFVVGIVPKPVDFPLLLSAVHDVAAIADGSKSRSAK